MRARYITAWFVGVLFAFSGITPPAQAAMPTIPEAAPSVASVPAIAAVPQAKKAKKKLPKWVCSRIYIEGKPARPTAVKVWCNGGKTLVKLKTKGLKPGAKANHSTERYYTVKKGKYHNFAVFFRSQRHGQGELRVFYDYGKSGGGIALRNPWIQAPKKTRVLLYKA